MNNIIERKITHQELKRHFSRMKNFDAWIAALRRRHGLIPPSIRKGNESPLKRGNIGLHPAAVMPYLEKIIDLRERGYGYKKIKEELRGEKEKIEALYNKKFFLEDRLCKPESLIITYEAVLKALDEYYEWGSQSLYGTFFRKVLKERKNIAKEYFNTLKKLLTETDNQKKSDLQDKKKELGRDLGFCYEIIYFVIREYTRLRDRKEVKKDDLNRFLIQR